MPISLVELDTVDSTNLEARRRLRDGQITGDVAVVAREQSAGRGRFDRHWCSPRDAGLYLTVVRYLPETESPIRPPDSELVTRAAGVAAAFAIHDTVGIAVQLRPINDLYLPLNANDMAPGETGDRMSGSRAFGKVGGVLVESIFESGRLVALFLGVGINTHSAARPTADGRAPAVALSEYLPPGKLDRSACAALRDATVAQLIRWSHTALRHDQRAVNEGWAHFADLGK